MRISAFIGVAALLLGHSHVVTAQCSDGSPPPCVRARVASAATARKDPPLDDKTWIIVPFNNVTRAQDVDYLRDASVNLLYLDMSRWTDIRVVDDARVADLMREVPGADKLPLSLDVATAIARRAGAGRLVMGNIIKQGSRTTIAAKVFDVRRATVIRSPQQDLVVQDSLMSVFGKLAGAILDVSPPAGEDIASIGTRSADAYQEYLAGNSALKRNDYAVARRHLDEALRLDSTFALPHYKLATLIGWQNPNDQTKVAHAAAAMRLSAGLPLRERTLMRGLNEFEQSHYRNACETYSSLVKADSADAEALYGVGECSYHNPAIVPLASDTTTRVFEGSWSTAIRAFRRVLALDPTYHLAYIHILDALFNENRPGFDFRLCPQGGTLSVTAAGQCLLSALPIRSGDSLLLRPIVRSDTTAARLQMSEYLRTESKRRNLELARDIARDWVDAAPSEARAHLRLALAYWFTGAVAEADKQLAMVHGDLTSSDYAGFFQARFEIAMKLGRGVEARQLVDSLAATPANANLAGVRQLKAVLGRPAAYDSVIRASVLRLPAAQQQSAVAMDYSTATRSTVLAGGDARTDSAERRYVEWLGSRPPEYAPRSLAGLPTYVYAPRRARSWFAIDPLPHDHRSAALAALAKGDTVTFRSEIRRVDSSWHALPALYPDSGAGVFLAEAYLAVRDSSSALQTVRRALDTTYQQYPMSQSIVLGSGLTQMAFWPRMALLRADLESAAGNRGAARIWYKRFLDLWGTADPEFQPIVERARKSLAALGTS